MTGTPTSACEALERERLRAAMRDLLLPGYAFVADIAADLALCPEGYVTWLALNDQTDSAVQS